jgi:hypothetical protein
MRHHNTAARPAQRGFVGAPTGFVNYLSRRINASATMAKKIEHKTDIRAAPAMPAT